MYSDHLFSPPPSPPSLLSLPLLLPPLPLPPPLPSFPPSLSPDAKLDAVELLLHSFSSAATFLNPQATRCACLYSLNFDPSGTLVGTSIQVYSE